MIIYNTYMTKERLLKSIAVSIENYEALKNMGRAGDSFNDVITDLIKRLK